MKSLSLIVFLVLALGFHFNCEADIVIDDGTFSSSTTSTGEFVSGTSNFTLTATQIPNVEFYADFLVIDDGVEIIVNGTSLFASLETSQFGAQDFAVTAVQPNDIADPWNPNSNSLPRLVVESDSSGTMFSGAVDTNTSSMVTYQPNFTVANFTSLLVAGDNTIEFINHNGSQGGRMRGSYEVSVACSVPEPTGFGIAFGLLGMAVGRRRRAI